MCCENGGSNLPAVGECPECGQWVDKNGDSLEICAYSSNEPCPICGSQPCHGGC